MKKRSEILLSDTWDLTSLYPSSAEWEKDFEKIKPELDRIVDFKGKLGNGPDTLLDLFCLLEVLERTLDKLYVYAHLKHDEETSDPSAKAMLERSIMTPNMSSR